MANRDDPMQDLLEEGKVPNVDAFLPDKHPLRLPTTSVAPREAATMSGVDTPRGAQHPITDRSGASSTLPYRRDATHRSGDQAVDMAGPGARVSPIKFPFHGVKH